MTARLRNKFEQKIASQLKKAKIPFEYEKTRLPFTITGWYIPDYTIPGPIFLEVKGYLRPETKRKMAGVRKNNPNADIRFIFQCRENTKQGRSYGRWAHKLGFLYCYGSVPKAWLQRFVG